MYPAHPFHPMRPIGLGMTRENCWRQHRILKAILLGPDAITVECSSFLGASLPERTISWFFGIRVWLPKGSKELFQAKGVCSRNLGIAEEPSKKGDLTLSPQGEC
eukprot:RCo007887